MKRPLILIALISTGIGLWAQGSPVIRNTIPQWLVPLREAVYEQRLTANQVRPLYETAKAAAQSNATGAALNVALSRCEYFMGRALHYENRTSEATVHYEEGMRLAESALAASPSADAWVMRAENLSQRCAIGPWTYTAANGLNVERFAKNGLALNSRNAAAQILVAARWVYAPAPFHDHRRGIRMMTDILQNGDVGKDDIFNIYFGIGWGHMQLRNYADARTWFGRAQEIYPTNKSVAEQLNNDRLRNL